jgi:hypothetical protein
LAAFWSLVAAWWEKRQILYKSQNTIFKLATSLKSAFRSEHWVCTICYKLIRPKLTDWRSWN